MIQNRFLRLLVSDRQFKGRLTFLAVFLGVALWQVNRFYVQEQQLSQLLQGKKIARQPWPAGRRGILSRTPTKKSMARRAEVRLKSISREFIFEGTTIKDGTRYALINGKIFVEGDAIEDYAIEEITREKAILRNRETKEIRMLYLKG